jgi:hypothetical protein
MPFFPASLTSFALILKESDGGAGRLRNKNFSVACDLAIPNKNPIAKIQSEEKGGKKYSLILTHMQKKNL